MFGLVFELRKAFDMANYSPLRYPGGKSRLADFISLAIENKGLNDCTYIEPFAGGAGVGLSLLLNGKVERIVINDYDKAVYSFWRAVKEDSTSLIRKIEDTPITIDEWKIQRGIFRESHSYSLEFAFATLFLNRTNRSGILTGGPIGGYEQDGKWKIDVRFDKRAIIEKICNIAQVKNRIAVYNKDIISFLRKYANNVRGQRFFYFDPPYYNKGQQLYKNFFTHKDHKKIHDEIVAGISDPWIITYDDVDEISSLYSSFYMRKFDLTYSAANKGRASEMMFFSDKNICPSESQMEQHKITISFR